MPNDFYNSDAILQTVIIAGASIAGAVVLAYYRRDLSYKEMFFKTGTASICGLVVGAVLTRYYGVEALQYVMAIYFFASLLSLFFIRGLLSVTEQNAGGMVITIVQRLLGSAQSGLKVTPDTTTPPNGAAIVTTDVIIKKDSVVVSESETSAEIQQKKGD